MNVKFSFFAHEGITLTKRIDDALPISKGCGVIPYEGGPHLVCGHVSHDLSSRTVHALLTSNVRVITSQPRDVLGNPEPFSVEEFEANGWEGSR